MPGIPESKRYIMIRNELALEIAEAKLKLLELQKNVGQQPELSAEITGLKALIERQTQVLEGRPSDNSRVARIGTAITPPDSTVVSLQASSQRVALERAARERQQRQERDPQFRCMLLSLGAGLAVGLVIGCAITYSGVVYELTDEGFGMTFGFPMVSTLVGGFYGMVHHMASQACARRREPIRTVVFAPKAVSVIARRNLSSDVPQVV